MGIVDLIILSIPIVATVSALFHLWHSLRERQWVRAATFAVILVTIHCLGYFLFGPDMRGYSYQGDDPQTSGVFQFIEVPFKGQFLKDELAQLQPQYKTVQLYRNFKLEAADWLNFYRWYDYTTNPRWKLPYRPERARTIFLERRVPTGTAYRNDR